MDALNDFSRFSSPGGQVKPAIPRFHSKAVEIPFKSEQAGRPVFEDRQFVEIIIPGDNKNRVVEPVNDGHKERWPEAWAAFEAGLAAPTSGTPLSEWPKVTRAQVENLAYLQIRTVEDLAGLNDNLVLNIGMGGRELRESARKFLDVSKNGVAPIERMISEIARLSQELAIAKRDLETVSAEYQAYRTETAGRLAFYQSKEMHHAGA